MEPTAPSTTPETPQVATPPPAPPVPPIDPSDHKRNLLPLVIGGIALLLAAVFTSFYLKSLIKPSSSAKISPTAAPSPSIAETSLANSQATQAATFQLTIDQELLNKLKMSGSSYTDPEAVYTILYPSDYKQDSQNNGQYVRIFKSGPTQKGQTEMYDGVIISIESISLGDDTLDSWVTKKIAAETENGTTTLEQSKESIFLNSYPGLTYTTQGQGTFKHIAIQKDATSKSAIDITMLIADPTNAGFQKETDTILSTITLQK